MEPIDLIRSLPPSIKRPLYRLSSLFVKKQAAEMAFWKSRWRKESGTFDHSHYERLFLAIAGEPNSSFVEGRVIADFGCGPRGSLCWARSAAQRIGIDLLVGDYYQHFSDALNLHSMIYVQSSEQHIPISSGTIDTMFTLNALDHVADLPRMCSELLRVLRPGGELIGSFNLNEPVAPCEPQTLTEPLLNECLLKHMTVKSYRITVPDEQGDPYGRFFSGQLRYAQGDTAVLWVRAVKGG